MKLFSVHDTAFFFETRAGFPVARFSDTGPWVHELGRIGALNRADQSNYSLQLSPALYEFITSDRLYRAGITLSAAGDPSLVPESDPQRLLFHPSAVLVSAGYNAHQQHVRFESSDSQHGVIFSHVPEVTGNWSRRSFVAAMRPGTSIFAIIQSGTKEQRLPLLEMEEGETFRFLYTEMPLGNFDSDDSWMDGLNKSRN